MQDIVPGMKTGQPIFSIDGLFLLAGGTVLSGPQIESLRRWEVPFVYIDLGFLPPDAFQPVLSPLTRQKAVKELQTFLRHSKHRSHLVRTTQMEESVVNLVDEVLQNQSRLLNLAEIRQYDDYLLGHSLGVCLLSVFTGVNLGWSRDKLLELGVAALLHDVGKVRVPQAILLKPGPLDQQEWVEVQKHPLYALEILDEKPGIMEAASQHHESLDGSGYPYGLADGAIGEFARIVAIADLYDAMTTDRVYRRAVPVSEALELIYGSGGSRFDLPLVRGFVSGLAAYPVGSVVELNDQSVGVVVENFPGLPLYPRVRILQEADRRPPRRPSEIDLGQRGKMITRMLSPQESFALSRRWHQAAPTAD